MSERQPKQVVMREKKESKSFLKEVLDSRLLTNLGLLAIGIITAVQLIALTGTIPINPAFAVVTLALVANDFRIKNNDDMKQRTIALAIT